MSRAEEVVLITGGAGVIGTNLVRQMLMVLPSRRLVVMDALTYSGSLLNLDDVLDHPRLTFVAGDIRDRDLVREVFNTHRPNGVIHLAAESHVDRSIADPLTFVETNVVGTVVLLQEATRAWRRTTGRFHHVSTDEVFGELGDTGWFDELSAYAPNSPYSASKAASDHFVRAWGASYGLDFVISSCSNNYGPYQFPEKLMPMTIVKAVGRERVPVYGDGRNVRDWIYVEDHCEALSTVYSRARSGATYVVGGKGEMSNIEIVTRLLDAVDRELGNPEGSSRELIEFVEDRPGHDFRYAMNTDRINADLGWRARTALDEGLSRTVKWYLANLDWVEAVGNEDHRRFQANWYGGRVIDGQG
jgi:dTDP-glucose 4,6-dehydratase